MKESRGEFRVVRAAKEHVAQVAALFNDYRLFYGQSPDLAGARIFIGERLRENTSVVYLAFSESDDRETQLGFTQLYPSYSSVSMKPLWILNDLYVAPRSRRRGVARALIERARCHAMETNAEGLILETGVDNSPAQALYDACGFVRDTEFHRYTLDI